MRRNLDACPNFLPSAIWHRRPVGRNAGARSFAAWLMTMTAAGAWLGGGAPLRAQAVGRQTQERSTAM
jgi:hypothetical protein